MSTENERLNILVDSRDAVIGYDKAANAALYYEAASGRVNKQILKTDGLMGGLKKSAMGLLPSLAALGSGFTLYSLISQAGDFQDALFGVSKTTDIVGADLDILGSKIQEVARRTGQGSTELLTLAKSAGQLGVTGSENILLFVETVAKLGEASDLVGEEAATALARILNVTGESTDKVGTLASVIVRLGNNFAATESEIAHITTSVAAATSQFDIGSTKSAAYATALASIGARAELGGSVLGRVFREMNTSVLSGTDNLKRFADISNVSIKEFSDAFRNDASDAFNIFLQGISGMIDRGEDVTVALDNVGLSGEEINKILPTLATRFNIVKDAMAQATDEQVKGTALTNEFVRSYEGFDSTLGRTWETIKSLAVGIGTTLLPVLTTALQAFNDFFEIFLKTDDLSLTDKILRGIAETVAIGGTLVLGLWGMNAAWTFMIGLNLPVMLSAITGSLAIMSGILTGGALALGALGTAGVAAFSLIAGFKIGEILSDQFFTVRLAGAELFYAVMNGWERVSLASKITFAFMEKAFDDFVQGSREVWAEFVDSMLNNPLTRATNKELAEWAAGYKESIENDGIKANEDFNKSIVKMRTDSAAQLAFLKDAQEGYISTLIAEENAKNSIVLINKELKDSAPSADTGGSIIAQSKEQSDAIKTLIDGLKERNILLSQGARQSLVFTLANNNATEAEKAKALAIYDSNILLERQAEIMKNAGNSFADNLSPMQEYTAQLQAINLLLNEQKLSGVQAAEATAAANEKLISDTYPRLKESIDGVFDTLSVGMTNAITDALLYGDSFTEALENVGKAIVDSVIRGLVQMGVQMAINAIQAQIYGTLATSMAVIQGAAVASAWATAAAMVSLATFGSNAAAATAGISATVASANALAFAGGAERGGMVNPGSFKEVGEKGRPELMEFGGKNYLIPGNKSAKVIPQRGMTSADSSSSQSSSNASIPQETNIIEIHISGSDDSKMTTKEVRELMDQMEQVSKNRGSGFKVVRKK